MRLSNVLYVPNSYVCFKREKQHQRRVENIAESMSERQINELNWKFNEFRSGIVIKLISLHFLESFEKVILNGHSYGIVKFSVNIVYTRLYTYPRELRYVVQVKENQWGH